MSRQHQLFPRSVYRDVPRLLICLAIAASLGDRAGARSADDDREAVRQALKQHWEALTTLSFQAVDEYYGHDGELDATLGQTRYDFAYKHGGKRRLIGRKTIPSGVIEIANQRDDGKKRYRILHVSDDPDAEIREVRIQDQPGDAERYEGPSFFAHTLWCPAGLPLHVHVADADRVEVHGKVPGHRRATVERKHPSNDSRIKMELDEEHDWLPVNLELANGEFQLQVTRFESQNGLWFSTEGNGRSRPDPRKGELRTEFRVSDLKINEPIADSEFQKPAVPVNVRINDQNKPRPVRKPSAPSKAQSAAPDSSPPDSRKTVVVAPRGPEEFPWATTVGAGSAALVLTGFLLRLIQSRRRNA